MEALFNDLGLSIPDGGVHIIGGDNGEAFITFASDEDGRMAMLQNGKDLSGSPVTLYLSSKHEMQAKIDELRNGAAIVQAASFNNAFTATPASQFIPQQQQHQQMPVQQQQQTPQAQQVQQQQIVPQNRFQPPSSAPSGLQPNQLPIQMQPNNSVINGQNQQNRLSAPPSAANVFNPRQPQFANQRFPAQRPMVPNHMQGGGGQQNTPALNQMQPQGIRPANAGFRPRGAFEPRGRFPVVRSQMDGNAGFRPQITTTPQARPARPGAFDIVRGSARPNVPMQQQPQMTQGPMNVQNQQTPGQNQININANFRPRLPFQRPPVSQASSNQGIVQGLPTSSDGSTNFNIQLKPAAPNAQPAPGQNFGMFGPMTNLARMPAVAPGFIRPQSAGTVATSVVSKVADPPPDFARDNERKLGDRSSFERIDRDRNSRSMPDVVAAADRNSSGSKWSSRDENSSKSNDTRDDEEKPRRRRSNSRDRSSNKRPHTSDSRSSVSPPPSKVQKSHFYCVMEKVSIDVTDSDIRDFLSSSHCKTNMKPIIIAKKNHCVVYLRFEDERGADKCMQLHGKRFLNETVRISTSSKDVFDAAYKEFQTEMNREIYVSLKGNSYKGEFIRISGLPHNVNNDDIMTHVLNGEKLQVDDIYVEYSDDAASLDSISAYVRAPCRKDSERYCATPLRNLFGRKVEIVKLTDSQAYQRIKDHQNRVASSAQISNSKSNRSPSSAREPREKSESRSSRRRSIPRSIDSADDTKRDGKDGESKSKQCPEDVCIEVMALPAGKFDKRDIREFFKKLKVMHVVFDPNDATKAYVEFDKDKEQVTALRMNNQKLQDHPMRILAIESSEYSRIYKQYKSQPEKKPPTVVEKSSGSGREGGDSLGRSCKRSAYPVQFYKFLFKKPLCISLESVRNFLFVSFESHIVLKRDPGGFTSEAFLMTCENPESHFLELEKKKFCNVDVIVCKISEDDFKQGTNNIQPSPSVASVNKSASSTEVTESDNQTASDKNTSEPEAESASETKPNCEERNLQDCIVKVSDLPPRILATDLENLLVDVHIRKNGVALFSDKREAIVILQTSSDREKALCKNDSFFMSQKIKVETCPIVDVVSRFPLAQLRPIALADMEELSNDYVIAMVSGIPKGCEAKQLQELLRPCKIVSVTFMRAVSTAFVQMQNSMDAQFCTLKTGLKIADNQVKVEPKRKADMEKMIADFKKKGSSSNSSLTPAAKTAATPSQNQTPVPVPAEATTAAAEAEEKPTAPAKKSGPPLPPIGAITKKPEFGVHITNLPLTVIKSDLIQLMQSLSVRDNRITIKTNEQGRVAEAIVLLANVIECKAASEFDQTFLGPNKISLRAVTGAQLIQLITSFGQIQSPFQPPTPTPKTNSAASSSNSANDSKSTLGFDPITLRLSGLPIDVRPADILDFFKEFKPNGDMLKISNDSITRACTANLSFNNRQLGLEALKHRQGQFLGGRKILITPVM